MPTSVQKAALVLDLFSVDHPHWGPSEVAGELGIAKSTAHALLTELTNAGLTERFPCGRYRLGWRTLGLARTMLATVPYRDLAMSAAQLAVRSGETVHFTALERGQVLYVASERPPDGVAAPAAPVAAPLTPAGTVLLAEHDAPTWTPTRPTVFAVAATRWGPARARRRRLRRGPGAHRRRPGDRRPRSLRARDRFRTRRDAYVQRGRAHRTIRSAIANGHGRRR